MKQVIIKEKNGVYKIPITLNVLNQRKSTFLNIKVNYMIRK